MVVERFAVLLLLFGRNLLVLLLQKVNESKGTNVSLWNQSIEPITCSLITYTWKCLLNRNWDIFMKFGRQTDKKHWNYNILPRVILNKYFSGKNVREM